MTPQPKVPNSSFSAQLPTLQLAWDSTSLSALKTCPRYYQLSIVEGWQPKQRSVHLSFGIWMHSARERYYHARVTGSSHNDAIDYALRYVLEATWDFATNRPWQSDEPTKTRLTLLRAIVWYCDQWEGDPMETIVLADGKPAVELSFRFPIDFRARPTGENYLLCGHIDRLATFNGEPYISDLKTTKHALDTRYYAQFSPSNQMTLYTFAVGMVYSVRPRGLIIDAIQMLTEGCRFNRAPITRTEAQLEEWYRDLNWWVAQAELYATGNYWPMNEASCFGCDFRSICSKSPSVREGWLESQFVRRVWDPLQTRGDI